MEVCVGDGGGVCRGWWRCVGMVKVCVFSVSAFLVSIHSCITESSVQVREFQPNVLQARMQFCCLKPLFHNENVLHLILKHIAVHLDVILQFPLISVHVIKARLLYVYT